MYVREEGINKQTNKQTSKSSSTTKQTNKTNIYSESNYIYETMMIYVKHDIGGGYLLVFFAYLFRCFHV